MKILRIVIVAGVLVGLGAAAYRLSPACRLGVQVMAGHSPVCPFAQAIQSAANVQDTTGDAKVQD